MRDESSRLLPGKKDTVRRKKCKRRVLVKSLLDLHKEYSQTAELKHRMSYRQFLRYKPFYVTEAKANDRNTCACYQHENMRLLIDALSQRGILPSKSLSYLLSSITCNTDNMKCMERTCTECCYDEVQIAIYNPDDRARWEHWAKEDVVVGDKTYKNWVKKTENGTVGKLVEEFNKELEGIAIHQFNWLHQAQKFRHLKENLKDNEMVLHRTQKFSHFILEETGSRHPCIQQWLTFPQAHNPMPQSLTLSATTNVLCGPTSNQWYRKL